MNLEVVTPLMKVRVSLKKVREKEKHMAIIVLSENYGKYANVKCVCVESPILLHRDNWFKA